MPDTRLRELERDAASGADPEATARLLAERVRVGTLDALLGSLHEPAKASVEIR